MKHERSPTVFFSFRQKNGLIPTAGHGLASTRFWEGMRKMRGSIRNRQGRSMKILLQILGGSRHGIK